MRNRRVRVKAKKRGSSRYFVLVLAALLLLFLLFLGVKQVLTKWEVFTIERIEVDGFSDLEEDFLLSRCNDLIGENLFSVSNEMIENRFENIVRVKSVKTGKRLPDKLKITIEERKTFLQVRSNAGHVYPLDREMIVLDTDRFYQDDFSPVVTTNLSEDAFVTGDVLSDSLLNRSCELIKMMMEYKKDFIHRISEIYEKDGDIVLIEVDKGLRIYLGDNNIPDKLEQFEFVAANREIEPGSIVDLSFTDKLILRSEE